jgi:hypothetical protein
LANFIQLNMKYQDISQYVCDNLAQKMRTYAKGSNISNQSDFQVGFEEKGISLAQSIISRLLNNSYPMRSAENKVFVKVAEYFGVSPDKLWAELSEGYEITNNTKDSPLYIGITSFASWTAAVFHTIFDYFPDWLHLTHTYENKFETNFEGDAFVTPVWITSENYRQKFAEDTLNNIIERNSKESQNPFLGLYTSLKLPPMLIHPTNKEDENRFLHGIFCPDQTIDSLCLKKEGSTYTLFDGNELVKVATLLEGFRGLICVIKIADESDNLTDEENNAGYKIISHHLNEIELQSSENKEKKFELFLGLLKQQENKSISNFIVRGVKGGAIFDGFKDFLLKKEKTEMYKAELSKEKNPERVINQEVIKKLMTKREPISFDTKDKTDLEQTSKAVADGQTLVLVGYSPFLDIIFDFIREDSAFTDKKIVLHRFNLSQWIGKTSCSFYLVKESFNPESLSKINQLFELITLKSNKASVASNDKLPSFYFPIKEGQSNEEAYLLYELVCKEMGLEKAVNMTYEPSLMQLLLKMFED